MCFFFKPTSKSIATARHGLQLYKSYKEIKHKQAQRLKLPQNILT